MLGKFLLRLRFAGGMKFRKKIIVLACVLWFTAMVILKKAIFDVELHQTLIKSTTDAYMLPTPPKKEVKTTELQSRLMLNRQAHHITREIWRLAKSQLKKSPGKVTKTLSQDELLSMLSEMTLLLETKLVGAVRVDGQAELLRNRLENLANAVQRKIHELQNPNDCNSARYLVTENNKACGFGCRVHHWTYCFSVAFILNRTFYFPNNEEDANFLPVTNCLHPGSGSMPFFDTDSEAQVVTCPIIDGSQSTIRPPALPNNIADELEGLHGAPFVWFAGQLLSHIFRLKPSRFKTTLEEQIKSLRNQNNNRGYRQPIAGIHIRRTDKVGTEAAFHSIQEYMVHVDRYFDQKDLEYSIANGAEYWLDDERAPPSTQKVKRRVFIATDEPSAMEEAIKLYPHYEFVGDAKRTRSASVQSRRTQASIQGIVTDVIMLANTDFLTCTFSSQVCRLAYELMQTQQLYLGDASQNFESLDDLYYFGGQQLNTWKPMIDSKIVRVSRNESFKIHGNHWDGFMKAERIKTGFSTEFLPAYLFHQGILRVRSGV